MKTQTSISLRRWPLATLVIVLAVLAIFAGGEAIQSPLQYDAEAIRSGQWWRLFTQHLTHWDSSHLFWDSVAFLVLGAACELRHRARFLACLALSAPLISLALLANLPWLYLCRGLSGLDSALFAVVVWQIAVENTREDEAKPDVRRVLVGGIAALLFVGKCLYEQRTGTMLFVNNAPDGPVVVYLAHLAGFACGLAVAAMFCLIPFLHHTWTSFGFRKQNSARERERPAAGQHDAPGSATASTTSPLTTS